MCMQEHLGWFSPCVLVLHHHTMQRHLYSCGGWIWAAEPCNSMGNEEHWKPPIRSSSLLLRSQMRIILLCSFWYCSPAVILCVGSFFSKHCCFPNLILWYTVNRLRGCWITAVMLFDQLPTWSTNRKHFFLHPLQTKQKSPNWRNCQAPVTLNKHNLELLEHLIFYKPWIWKYAVVRGHMWWRDKWKLLKHFPWEALGKQFKVAWGKARYPDL